MNVHNLILITGRLAAAPELKTTQSGISCCSFNVAVNRPYQKDKQQEADFIPVIAWRQTAEFVSRYFEKGSVITVLGSIRNNNYTDQNGVKHYSMNVQAENVSFGIKTNNKEGQAYTSQYNTPPPVNQNQASPEPLTARSQPAEEPVQIGDISDFEEILSDGEVPF